MEYTQLLEGRLLTQHELVTVVGKEKIQHYIEQLEQTMGVTKEQGKWTCQRCNNQIRTQFEWIANRRDAVYCLNCLNSGRVSSIGYLYHLPYKPSTITRKSCLTWSGTLSAEQKRASQALVVSLSESQPHLVHAVTGAGKTEMTFAVIDTVLRRGGRVCLASPRIDVCLELYPRLQQAFAHVEVSLLYGNSEEKYQRTEILVCTTHQLLRFRQAFDLIIVDEVDAFPYVNDASLHFAVGRSVTNKGKLIYLTATPDKMLQKKVQQQTLGLTVLPARYHGKPLVVPTFKWVGNWRVSLMQRRKCSWLIYLLRIFLQQEGVKLIFMPDIALAEQLHEWLGKLLPNVRLECVHSKDERRKEKVEQLRKGELDGLVTTTILERGVTFANCHVMVVGSEDSTYSESVLVQIAGRVGRKAEYPTGVLWYAHFGKSRAMKRAKKQIVAMNQQASERGLLR